MIQELRAEFWQKCSYSWNSDELNVELEKANRVADFLELGELLLAMLYNVKNHVAVTSVKNIKQKKVKQNVTIQNMHTLALGNTKVTM